MTYHDPPQAALATGLLNVTLTLGNTISTEPVVGAAGLGIAAT